MSVRPSGVKAPAYLRTSMHVAYACLNALSFVIHRAFHLPPPPPSHSLLPIPPLPLSPLLLPHRNPHTQEYVWQVCIYICIMYVVYGRVGFDQEIQP